MGIRGFVLIGIVTAVLAIAVVNAPPQAQNAVFDIFLDMLWTFGFVLVPIVMVGLFAAAVGGPLYIAYKLTQPWRE